MTMPLMRPARKNPILRTPQMNLPPSARSRVALGLTAAAAEGRFELQVCQDCDSVQYPPREACVHCVSPRLKWRAQSGWGQLLASTTLHHSNDLFFRERLPEIETAAVGVKVRHRQRASHGGNGFGRWAERVFVGGDLDDLRRLETEFARGFVDRFSRFVSNEIANKAVGVLGKAHDARSLGPGEGRFKT